MAKSKKQADARALRKQGLSIKDISEKLGVSKSSASIWCRDIRLTADQIQSLHEKMVVGGYAGRLKGAHIQRDKKQEKIKDYLSKAKEKIFRIQRRELLIAGLALYWGEGGKTNSAVRIYNSDPLAIQFMMRWFREAFDIPDERFYMNVTINNLHKERLAEVIDYWAHVTGIPVKQFRKPILIKSKNKKIYENHFQHYGTLCIRITKSSDLFYEIKGLIGALSDAR
jgi:transcriptional regulator with XRE-family HTH domain